MLINHFQRNLNKTFFILQTKTTIFGSKTRYSIHSTCDILTKRSS